MAPPTIVPGAAARPSGAPRRRPSTPARRASARATRRRSWNRSRRARRTGGSRSVSAIDRRLSSFSIRAALLAGAAVSPRGRHVAETRVLIANRGEIAVRVIRTCRELGIPTVAVYSDADREALFVDMADEAYRLGPATRRQSYLNVEAILDAAAPLEGDDGPPRLRIPRPRTPTSPAPSPAAGLTFIGPPPEAMDAMGDKVTARAHRGEGRRPHRPRDPESDHARSRPQDAARQIGFPIAVKAAYGGGGRGMHVVTDPGRARRGRGALGPRGAVVLRAARGLPGALHRARPPRRGADHRRPSRQRELPGRARLHAPAPLPEARRGEPVPDRRRGPAPADRRVGARPGQGGRLPERRAPSSSWWTTPTAPTTSWRSTRACRSSTRSPRWSPAWTWSRCRSPSPWARRSTSRPDRRGHAIECRLNAEDPYRDFLPGPRPHHAARPPGRAVRAARRRVRGRAGRSRATTTRCSRKLIVWGEDRERARRRMLRALGEMRVEGVPTTDPVPPLGPADARVHRGDGDHAAGWRAPWRTDPLGEGRTASSPHGRRRTSGPACTPRSRAGASPSGCGATACPPRPGPPATMGPAAAATTAPATSSPPRCRARSCRSWSRRARRSPPATWCASSRP